MALIKSALKSSAVPAALDMFVSNSSGGATWSYVTIPADLLANYTKIKYQLVSSGGSISECKYGNFDPDSTITDFHTLDNLLSANIGTSDTAISGITKDLVIGVYCSTGAVAKVTLS